MVLLPRGNKVGSLIHLFGGMTYGFDDFHNPQFTFLDDSYVLDIGLCFKLTFYSSFIDLMTWREINRQANKPLARAFHTTTLVNGNIYILGGANHHLGVWTYPTDIRYLVPGKTLDILR